MQFNIKFTFYKYLEKNPNMIPYDILKKDFEELKNYTTISKKYNISINIIKTWFKNIEY